MKIAPNDTVPTLPPLSGVAPLDHAPCTGDGQNWLLASAGIAVVEAATPKPQQRWMRMSPLNRRGKLWPQTPPLFVEEVKSNNQLATGASKMGGG
jgi:hypothetical protein